MKDMTSELRISLLERQPQSLESSGHISVRISARTEDTTLSNFCKIQSLGIISS